MIYPTVDKNGKFGEQEFDGQPPRHFRVPIFPKYEMHLKPDVTEALVSSEHFTAQQMGYRMDDKVAYVQIYVSEDFYGDDKSRKRNVDLYLERHTPWLFSYALRRNLNEV